jgi:glucose uptake protein GlcU
VAEVRERLARIQSSMATAVKREEMYAVTAVTLPVAAWTIVAAIRLNKRKRNSARWFARAITALAAVEVVQLIYAIRVQQLMRPMLHELLTASIPPSTSLPANVDAANIASTMRTFIEIVTVAGLVLGLGFAAGKIFACLYARHCAGKPEVVEWAG